MDCDVSRVSGHLWRLLTVLMDEDTYSTTTDNQRDWLVKPESATRGKANFVNADRKCFATITSTSTW